MPITRGQAAQEAALLADAQQRSMYMSMMLKERDSKEMGVDIDVSTNTASTKGETVEQLNVSIITSANSDIPQKGSKTYMTDRSLISISQQRKSLRVVLRYDTVPVQMCTRSMTAATSVLGVKRKKVVDEQNPIHKTLAGQSNMEGSKHVLKKTKLAPAISQVGRSTRPKKQPSAIQSILVDGFRYNIKDEDDSDFSIEGETMTVVSDDLGAQRELRDRGKKVQGEKFRFQQSLSDAGLPETSTTISSESGPTSGGNVSVKVAVDQSTKELVNRDNTEPAPRLTIKFRKLVPKRKPLRMPKGFFSNKVQQKFGWSCFSEFAAPTKDACHGIHELLRSHHNNLSFSGGSDALQSEMVEMQGPMHAGEGITVDALVKTIMSQATDNILARIAHKRLCMVYKYIVNGERVEGKVPNYHSVRTSSMGRLASVLKTAGLYRIKANFIKPILDIIWRSNCVRQGVDVQSSDGNPRNARDFVPGLLSLDYLKDFQKQELFDHLVEFPGVGQKTAACIMAFNFEMPVFAVDTHVFRFVKWLKWVPDDCENPNRAFNHLDAIVPDELKYVLHQLFWHHGRDCLRCKAITNPKSKGWNDCVCPIEQYLDRSWQSKKTKPRSARKGRLSDSDSASSSSPKKAKLPRTVVPFEDLSLEEARKQGYDAEPIVIDINDNYDAARSNTTGQKRYWVRIFTEESEELETISNSAKELDHMNHGDREQAGSNSDILDPSDTAGVDTEGDIGEDVEVEVEVAME